jgi:hypothetical protein
MRFLGFPPVRSGDELSFGKWGTADREVKADIARSSRPSFVVSQNNLEGFRKRALVRLRTGHVA